MDKIQEVDEEFQEIWNEPEEVMNENGEFFEKIITKPIYNKYLILIFLYSIYIYYIIQTDVNI